MIRWTPRLEPLRPEAVAGTGLVALALGRALLQRDDATLARLSGAVEGRRDGKDRSIVILASEDDLPWRDGAVFLGRDPAAPTLLVPTNLEPSVPLDLFARAAVEHIRPSAVSTIAVLGAAQVLIPIPAGAGIVRSRLEQWLEAER